MVNLVAAEVFHPGEFLKQELDERNWTQAEFSEIINRPAKLINQIIAGKSGITPETAMQFAEAFNHSPEYWLQLQNQYLLSKVKKEDNFVKRKAFLHDKFPVREMIKRGWIIASDSIEILEKSIRDFFELENLTDHINFTHSAKKSNYEIDISIQQYTWLFQAKRKAKELLIATYSKENLKKSLEKLSALLYAPEEIRHVYKILADAGVRLVFVEALPNSKIDGACFWIDNSPVIAMSLRLDRIDNFWFVLRHEIEHVLQEDGKNEPILDEEVGLNNNQNLPKEEIRANKAAAEFCVPQDQLVNYIIRNTPYVFTESKIIGFSERLKIHPGLIVGQLQYKTGNYKMLRKYLVKTKDYLLESICYEGWNK